MDNYQRVIDLAKELIASVEARNGLLMQQKIDALEQTYKEKFGYSLYCVEYMKKNTASFIIDQIVHIAVIVALWLSLFGHNGIFCQELFRKEWNSLNIWIIVTAYLLILKPASVFLSLFIKKWTPSATAEKSLPNAGKWIGYFERILYIDFHIDWKCRRYRIFFVGNWRNLPWAYEQRRTFFYVSNIAARADADTTVKTKVAAAQTLGTASSSSTSSGTSLSTGGLLCPVLR